MDDLAVQAADDALMSILRQLDDYRGATRFTTWACKFAVVRAELVRDGRGQDTAVERAALVVDAAKQLGVGVAEGLHPVALQLGGDRVEVDPFGGGRREDAPRGADVAAEGQLDIAVVGEGAQRRAPAWC